MRVLVTGSSRGIGAAIAKCFALHHGASAKIALLGRSLTSPSHEKLSGTLQETAKVVEVHGALALPVQVDVRNGAELKNSVEGVIRSFGGLDVLVNNASALWLSSKNVSVDEMDLVHQTNARATLICLEACRSALAESKGSVVTLSPPIRLGRLEWISQHPAYTLSKYNMTLATLAAASDRIRANCVWPKHTISTSATWHIEETGALPGAYTLGRPPELFAEAVHRLAVDLQCVNAASLLDEDLITMPPCQAPLDAFVEHVPKQMQLLV